MKAVKLSDYDKESVSRKVKNLQRRLRHIEGDENLSQYAVNKFKDFMAEYGSDIKNFDTLDFTRRTTLLRDLLYINDLKTSKHYGALHAQNTYSKIQEIMEGLTDEQKGRLKYIFDKGYELPQMYEVRYEEMQTISDMIVEGKTDEEIIKEITDKYTEVYERFGGNIQSGKARVLLSEKLQGLRGKTD